MEKSPLVQSEGAGDDDEAAVPDDETEGTAYNYSFFHLSFALVCNDECGEVEESR